MQQYKNDLKAQIDKTLCTLNEKEQKILRKRFGIGDDTAPQTLEEVGKEFEVTLGEDKTDRGRSNQEIEAPFKK